MYNFLPMTEESADEVAFKWKYDGEYSFYDMTADEEDLKEFLEGGRNGYYMVEKTGEVIGYFSFSQNEDGSIEIGLGMKPEVTGKGLGLEFVKEGMKFAMDTYKASRLTLAVAAFNKRAIKVYEKAGFRPVETFMQDTNGSRFEFLRMTYI